MSSPRNSFVVNDSEDDTSRPQNNRGQTGISETANEETERSPKTTGERTGHKLQGPFRLQSKGSSPTTPSVRKNTIHSISRRSPQAQPTASTKSPPELSPNPPKLVRFQVAGRSSPDKTKEKQLTTTVEGENNIDGARDLEVMLNPIPNVLTQKDLEQLLPPKPLLPRTDAEFEDRYRELKVAAMSWVKQHFSKDFAKPLTSFDILEISNKNPELIQYINCIVSSGRDSWEDIFVERRIALIYGVLGKVIEVHVFGEEMFGASDRQRTTLRGIDLEMLNLNGRRLTHTVISRSPDVHLADFHPVHRLRPPKSARWYNQRLSLRPRPRASPGTGLLPCPAPGAPLGSSLVHAQLPSAPKIPP